MVSSTMNRLAYWSLRLGGFVAWNGHRKRNSKILNKIMAEELKEDKLVVPADKATANKKVKVELEVDTTAKDSDPILCKINPSCKSSR